MMIRRLLAFSVMLLSLFVFGCGFIGDSQSENQPKAQEDGTPYSRKLSEDRDKVARSLGSTKELIEKIRTGTNQSESSSHAAERSSPTPKPSSTKEPPSPEIDKGRVSEALSELQQTGELLDELQAALRPVADTEKSLLAIEKVKTARTNAISNLSALSNALNDENESKPDNAKLNQLLKDTKTEIESALTQSTQINIPPDLEKPSSPLVQMIYAWVPTIVIAIAAIFGLVLLMFVIKALLKVSSDRTEARIASRLKPLASNVQKQHEDFAAQLSKLTNNQNDLRTRIDEFEVELKRVSRMAREAANDGMRGRPLSSPLPVSFRESVEKVEPVFPISIGDYLNRMQRSSNIVRPDFQNDILVSDPGGTGELVLIRDTAIPDDLQPLFVVPRATQFQTKQDFYTYYQKYYECDRPSAGDVWIIDPAVVSRVSGGWQLREKGVLEVR
jgi:hypothetical protein